MSFGQLPVRASMACYLKFEGNSNDSSGNGYNGTDTSMSYSLGKFGQSALFASTSIITMPTTLATAKLANSTTGTISFWINPSFVSNAYTDIFKIQASSDSTMIRVSADWRTANKQLDIRLHKDSGTASWQLASGVGSLDLMQNKWNHICIVQDGVSPVVYINGFSPGIVAGGALTLWCKAVITDATAKATTPILGKTTTFNSFLGYSDEFIFETTLAWPQSEVRKYYTQAKWGL